MVKKEKDQSEYSKTVRTVDSPMDGQILMHFILFFYFFLNEIWQLRMVELVLVSTPFPMWKDNHWFYIAYYNVETHFKLYTSL